MGTLSIDLDFPTEIIDVLTEDFEEDEKLVAEVKSAFKSDSENFFASFSTQENCIKVLKRLEKFVREESSLTVYFHCHNLNAHLVDNLILEIKFLPEINELKLKLETGLEKRIERLDISELENLSEFAKNEQTLDPNVIKFMLKVSEFPAQQSFPILLNLLQNKCDLQLAIANEGIVREVLSLKINELITQEAKINFLAIIKQFLKIEPLLIQKEDRQMLKTCFLNFITELGPKNRDAETLGLIELFELSLNKIFTVENPLPAQCIRIMSLFPEFGLTPPFVEYCETFLVDTATKDEEYVSSLLKMFHHKINDSEKKKQVFGGNFGNILLDFIISSDYKGGLYLDNVVACNIIPIFHSGSGSFNIDAGTTESFSDFFRKEKLSKIKLDTVSELLPFPDNFEDKSSFADLVQNLGNAKFLDPADNNLVEIDFISTCRAMSAIAKTGFKFNESVIQEFITVFSPIFKDLGKEKQHFFTALLVTILENGGRDISNWGFWPDFLRDNLNMDESGYVVEAVLKYVDIKLDKETWEYLLLESKFERRNKMFVAFATLATEGKFPRDKIVAAIRSQGRGENIIFWPIFGHQVFEPKVEFLPCPERTLSLLRAWIKNEDNENIESEISEIFDSGKFYLWEPNPVPAFLQKFVFFGSESGLNSVYSDITLFEIHECLLERWEKRQFKIGPKYQTLLFEYIQGCLEFPPLENPEFKINPILFGVDLLLKIKKEVFALGCIELETITKLLDSHIEAGIKFEDENGDDKVSKARNKAANMYPMIFELEGKFFWQLVHNIFPQMAFISKIITKSSSSLQKSINDLLVKNHLEPSSLVFKFLELSTNKVNDDEVANQLKSMENVNKEETFTSIETKIFPAGTKLYQLVFQGAGLTYSTGITSLDYSEEKIVKIPVKIEPLLVLFLEDIKVISSAEAWGRPEDVMLETRGGSEDTNAGFGGKYVWLVPIWTKDKNKGATSIEIFTQSDRKDGYCDLAEGAGGKFRYIRIKREVSSPQRIVKVGLLRSPKPSYIANRIHEFGWDLCSGDINEDRKGDWLHICWNYIEV